MHLWDENNIYGYYFPSFSYYENINDKETIHEMFWNIPYIKTSIRDCNFNVSVSYKYFSYMSNKWNYQMYIHMAVIGYRKLNSYYFDWNIIN